MTENISKFLKTFKLPGSKDGMPYDPLTGHNIPLDPYTLFMVKYLTVVTEYDNYIECTDDVDGGQTLWVAKPRDFRRLTYDGKTRRDVTYTYASATSRTATDGTYTQTEVITPRYHPGEVDENGVEVEAADKILCIFRETEIKVDKDDSGYDEDNLIEWEDLGIGRVWATGLV